MQSVLRDRSQKHTAKEKYFKKLEEVLDTDAIIATNGSTVIISELAADLDHKERCVSFYSLYLIRMLEFWKSRGM